MIGEVTKGLGEHPGKRNHRRLGVQLLRCLDNPLADRLVLPRAWIL